MKYQTITARREGASILQPFRHKFQAPPRMGRKTSLTIGVEQWFRPNVKRAMAKYYDTAVVITDRYDDGRMVECEGRMSLEEYETLKSSTIIDCYITGQGDHRDIQFGELLSLESRPSFKDSVWITAVMRIRGER